MDPTSLAVEKWAELMKVKSRQLRETSPETAATASSTSMSERPSSWRSLIRACSVTETLPPSMISGLEKWYPWNML